VFVGHVQNIYNLMVIDDGIFTSYSYDGTIRWWNTQVRACFSFFNVIKILFSLKNISELIKFYVLISLNFHCKIRKMPNLHVKDAH